MIAIGNCLAFLPLSFAALFDFRRRIIPSWTVFLIISCAAFNIAVGVSTPRDSILGLLIVGIFLLFAAARLGGIGGGDVKLCAALGALLGLERMLALLILALLALIICGSLQKKKSMPFAPFLWGAFYILQIAGVFLQGS